MTTSCGLVTSLRKFRWPPVWAYVTQRVYLWGWCPCSRIMGVKRAWPEGIAVRLPPVVCRCRHWCHRYIVHDTMELSTIHDTRELSGSRLPDYHQASALSLCMSRYAPWWSNRRQQGWREIAVLCFAYQNVHSVYCGRVLKAWMTVSLVIISYQ
jgi:hypothetical protein